MDGNKVLISKSGEKIPLKSGMKIVL